MPKSNRETITNRLPFPEWAPYSVSSFQCSFPRWNRNLGTGDPLIKAEKMIIAKQTVYHDPNYPSVVILPVID